MHRTILPSALVLFALLSAGGPAAEAKKPARDSALVELGRRLFMDPAVSRNGRFSCADCHSPEHGFSDPRVLSEDENGKTQRHSQTLIDLEDNVGMHWDGEFDKVRELLVARLATAEVAVSQANELHRRHFSAAAGRGQNPNSSEYKKKLQVLTPPYYGPEMNPRQPAPRAVPVALRLQNGGYYAKGFKQAFGAREITTDQVIDAVEAYVFSIRSTPSPFDLYVKGDKSAINESAKRGLELFSGKANCASCHSGFTFTDNIYRNTGVAFKNVRLDFKEGFTADGGLGMMSFVEEDLGKFKTPTLRDVATHPPYMHDGSLKTLEEVVRYYDRGATPNAGLHKNIKPLHLSDGEADDLVVFLKTLTGEERPALGRPAMHRPSRTHIRIVNLHGKPLRDKKITVTPFGDRLKGDTRAARLEMRTNSGGWITFKFPLWTHVKLEMSGFEVGEDRPLPDYVRRTTIIATPRSKISMRVIAPKGTMMPAKIRARALVRSVTTRGNGAPAIARLTDVAMFTRVRRISANEALYVAPVSRVLGPNSKIFGRHTVQLSFAPRRGRNFMRVLDLSGGATETIDLRPAK